MTFEKNILKAAQIIKDGGIVAFPTETVYGLGAGVFNTKAIEKIFRIKERPFFDPLIVHISEIKQLELLVKKVDENILKLAEKFWPGPLTIVTEKNENVPDLVTANLPTVAVRMPNHRAALQLIQQAGTPIAAPSANKFGRLSPTNAKHVLKQLKNIDFIIDDGNTEVGIESTVISLNREGFTLLRPGVISKQDLSAVIRYTDNKFFIQERGLQSPGLLKSHYSPKVPLYILGEEKVNLSNKKIGFLTFGANKEKNNQLVTENLSPTKNLKEAATKLYEALHKLEESGVELIIAEPVPETGIGIAIMDRLRKAAAKKENLAEIVD
ncbi:L-threonylcarbamoyladenylate synthase [Mariniphaga sp.]|uniref:L-threonylcarbamoyladenylate synthase n=1 Tax=Mariniphaga sp. TaxID=1954475 RepID=UPI003568D49B